jgi:epoxyqueuosine reductase QueG
VPEFQPLRVEIKSSESLADPATEEANAVQLSTSELFSLFNPTLGELASMTEEDFKKIFAHSPIKRTKYRGWLRNLCVAMGNSGDRRFIPWLETAISDSDPIVSEHAAYAIRRLQESP